MKIIGLVEERTPIHNLYKQSHWKWSYGMNLTLLCPPAPTVGERIYNTSVGKMASAVICTHPLYKSIRLQWSWCSTDSLLTLRAYSFAGYRAGNGVLLGTSWLHLIELVATLYWLPGLKWHQSHQGICRQEACVEVTWVLGWWEELKNEKCAEEKQTAAKPGQKVRWKDAGGQYFGLCKTGKDFLVSICKKGKWVALETQ